MLLSRHTKRREFIALLGGAVSAWPLATRAQQRPAMPVVGYLSMFAAVAGAIGLAAFRKGLGEQGYVDGRTVAIEPRFADNTPARLPALAADLVRLPVAAMFVGTPPAARAAIAITKTIPIVFNMGEDPVKEGLVTSLNRPGGNVTGFTDFGNGLIGKRLGILHEIVSKTAPFALLVNAINPNAEPDTNDARAAAAALGRRLTVLTASTTNELDAAFATMAQQHIGAVHVGLDGFFLAQREQIAALAARHAIPAIYPWREFPPAGGLMSYGSDRVAMARQASIYVARILRGEKPADLPVQQATKFEFVINLRTAKALGLDIPSGVLAIVDEVIE
jgi:putative ABC transport system substrate-binding protein